MVITQVSSGFQKKQHILIFSKNKYLDVKIASLATVKSWVTIGPIHYWQMFGPVVSVEYLSPTKLYVMEAGQRRKATCVSTIWLITLTW